MFWILISVAMCAALVVRLLFWTDEHRRESRWYYRVLLFVVTVYAANNVVDFLYDPWAPISPWIALFHMILLYGSFLIRPHHLPWNGQHDSASEARGALTDITSRLRYRLRRTSLHGGEAQPAGGKRGADTSPHRFR